MPRPLRVPPLREHDKETSLFSPGDLLAGRYRIAGFLGRGGMGEIYRVDDLRLGQTVALKFLPEWLADDGAALARFHREVRLARQVSHPNVCRVFDVGEARGRPFLSMEYIDGEDLRSLLRRIGRFPTDKAVETARQICAGLAAIHEAGVLHRDLKPANVMIDARGRARIADFGVAALANELSRGEAKAGTPAYMAPEQISAGETSVRSDLYSLGLILYEMFTGRRPFKASERVRAKPLAPSSLVADIDPAIERAILRCLEHDPRDRPISALALVYTLTGGDPIAAALAAGETPSPEMVAASPKVGNLKPWVAGLCLAGVLLCLLGILRLSASVMAFRQVPLPQSAEVLAGRARNVLASLGYKETAVGSAYGFAIHEDYRLHLLAQDRLGHGEQERRWLAEGRPPLYLFWYRQSPQSLSPVDLVVTPEDPPRTTPGEALVVLDPQGRLYQLEVVPGHGPTAAGRVRAPDWAALLRIADLDPARLSRRASLWAPAVYADARATWEGPFPGPFPPPGLLRVQAAAYEGKPVSFELVEPWRMPSLPLFRPEAPPGSGVAYVLVALGAGLLMARRNLRLGRGDRRGAYRLALFAFVLYLLSWILEGAHNFEQDDVNRLFHAVTLALTSSALAWCAYLGLEPSLRRRWPDRVTSWSRLLAGQVRNPLVGRDLLVGCLLGLGVALVACLRVAVDIHLNGCPGLRLIHLDALLGFQGVARELCRDLFLAIMVSLEFTLIFLLAQILLRRERLGVAVLFGVYIVLTQLTIETNSPVWMTLLFVVAQLFLQFSVWLRFGLLADMTGRLVFLLILRYPVSSDLSAWYSGTTLFVIAVIAGLAVYGFATSIAGRPWLRDAVVDG